MTRTVSVGGRELTIRSRPVAGRFLAQAERAENHDRFGPPIGGDSEAEAIDRCAAWLLWQYDHEAALAALQDAERNYQRSVAASAFAAASDGPMPDIQREARDALDSARVRLEEIRERQPAR